ncbi:MAG: DUF1467 family protein [Pseudomonadota bacterium]
MNWVTGILVYVMTWWVVFFAVLPWGVKPPENPQPGHATSAPDRPMLWRKAAITTGIAAVIWGIVYLGVENSWIDFRP